MSDRNMLDGIFYRRIDSLEDLIRTVIESDEISNLIKRNSDIRLIVLDSIAFHFRYSLLSSFENTSSNIGKLHRISQVLNEIAHQYNVVVILTNQMTTRPRPSGISNNYIFPILDKSRIHNSCLQSCNCFLNLYNLGPEHMSNESSNYILTPALGDSWSHACSTRIIMDFLNKSTLDEVINFDEKARQLMRNIAYQNESYHKYKCLYMVKSPKHKTPTTPAVFRVTSEGIRDAF